MSEREEKSMGLRSYIIKRIFYSILLIFFVITINFIIFQLMPGSPLASFMDPRLQPEQLEELRIKFGLDQPVHIKFYRYTQNLLTFEFGYSYLTGELVSKEIMLRLANTLMLMGTVTVFSLVVGVILGVIAAHKRGGIFDTVSVFGSLTTYAFPSFWMGMIFLMIFAFNLRWFPLGGTIPKSWAINPPQTMFDVIAGRLRHLFLPALTLFLFSYGGYLLLTRALMMETLTEDYVTTARAKGLKERTVLYKHALKNAALPLITQAAMTFGFLISGAVITEQVFSWHGLGQWIWSAIYNHDYPVMQCFFFLIALCVIVANFIGDLLLGVVDPRIKYG